MNIVIKSFNTTIHSIHGWKTISLDGITYHIAGDGQSFKKIANIILSSSNLSDIDALLKKEKGVFSYIITGSNFIFASVDRIKSYPIFYGVDQHQKLHVSNCPYQIKEQAKLSELDHQAMLGFSMTSYTLGNKTLYESLYQLQAGEYLLWQYNTAKLIVHRYYRYLPKEDKTLSRQDLIAEQASIMDNVIARVINKANGRLICLPLSGGLDSRILLTKLVEKKYDRIKVISYGLSGNFEAKMAKQVAKQLKVAWQFIPAKPHHAKKLYHSQQRLDYAKFISALHTVPSYLEYEALIYLNQQGVIPQDSVIVNGQSGDFITGGHLPKLLTDKDTPNFDDLVTAAIRKHGSLWSQLINQENIDYIRQQIIDSLPYSDYNALSKADLLASYESWEWQERQCKAVIKGQRLYDFFHYDWALPLWDPELMDFWAKVPFEWKLNQNLYIEYLQTYYPKLFNPLRPIAQPWVTRFKWIPVFAKLYGLCQGKEKKDDYYKRMYYYATDYNQYALISRKYYLAHYKNTRGPVPFLVSLTLDELGILSDSPIADTKPV